MKAISLTILALVTLSGASLPAYAASASLLETDFANGTESFDWQAWHRGDAFLDGNRRIILESGRPLGTRPITSLTHIDE